MKTLLVLMAAIVAVTLAQYPPSQYDGFLPNDRYHGIYKFVYGHDDPRGLYEQKQGNYVNQPTNYNPQEQQPQQQYNDGFYDDFEKEGQDGSHIHEGQTFCGSGKLNKNPKKPTKPQAGGQQVAYEYFH